MRAIRRVMSGTIVTRLSLHPGYSSPMRADQHELPTPRATLRSVVPLVELRFRGANCGSGLTDFVVTATEVTGRPR
jgi:hypothetical protein